MPGRMLRSAVRHKVWMVGCALVLASVIAGGIAWTSGRTNDATSSKAALSTVSAQGTEVRLPPKDVRTKRLHGSHVTDVTLLGTVGGRNLYRVEGSVHPCYGAGDAGASWPLGVISCRIAPPYFPSPEMPLFDFSTVGMDRGDAAMHYIRVEGVAAGGVASVEVLDRSGSTVERLPVRANVYGAESLPSATGVRLVARDASGDVVGGAPLSP
jgi:hypothetical protein